MFGSKAEVLKNPGDEEEDDDDAPVEDNEEPVYAESGKIQFKEGVKVEKSPYTKIFEVSIILLSLLETREQI